MPSSATTPTPRRRLGSLCVNKPHEPQPQRALVRPRVTMLRSGQRLLLEEEVAALLAKRRGGHLMLLGGTGSGKTSALRHLAYVFAGHSRLRLHDDTPPRERPRTEDVVVEAAPSEVTETPHEKRYLAPWNDEQCTEYVAAAHPSCVIRTMSAWQRTGLVAELGRWPGICTCVLDHFSQAPDASGFAILREVLDERLPAQRRVTAMRQALRSYAPRTNHKTSSDGEWSAHDSAIEELGLLRALSLRGILAAEQLVDSVLQQQSGSLTRVHWHPSLVEGVHALLAHAPDLRARLEAMLPRRSLRHRGIVLSLLNTTGERYRPPSDSIWGIPGARLTGADMHRIHFYGDLHSVDLAEADLRGAVLDECNMIGATLRGALLEHASMTFIEGAGLVAPGIQARAADLHYARMPDSNLHSADLSGAILRNAVLTRCTLNDACLRGADLRGADLTAARMTGADLTSARLQGANLSNCRLDPKQRAQAMAGGAALPREAGQ